MQQRSQKSNFGNQRAYFLLNRITYVRNIYLGYFLGVWPEEPRRRRRGAAEEEGQLQEHRAQ